MWVELLTSPPSRNIWQLKNINTSPKGWVIGPYQNINKNGNSEFPFEEGRTIIFSNDFRISWFEPECWGGLCFHQMEQAAPWLKAAQCYRESVGSGICRARAPVQAGPYCFSRTFGWWFSLTEPLGSHLRKEGQVAIMIELNNICHTSSTVLGPEQGTSTWGFSLSPGKHLGLCLPLPGSWGQTRWQLLQLRNVSEPWDRADKKLTQPRPRE